MKNKFILGLDEACLKDLPRVGGKNASLGEMIQHLDNLGVRIPAGFIITVEAYQEFISFNQLDAKINS
jgi:pyruvate,water dikinase